MTQRESRTAAGTDLVGVPALRFWLLGSLPKPRHRPTLAPNISYLHVNRCKTNGATPSNDDSLCEQKNLAPPFRLIYFSSALGDLTVRRGIKRLLTRGIPDFAIITGPMKASRVTAFLKGLTKTGTLQASFWTTQQLTWEKRQINAQSEAYHR